jgi:ATP diphosphatase
MTDIKKLLEVMRKLRDPQDGCPWDVEQSFATIAPYTIEEAYEVADAIAREDMDDLRDELGDLLFQVVFYAQMANEEGHFDFADVAGGISEKMIRRHPHVFGSVEERETGKVDGSWDEIKELERSAAEDSSALAGVAKALPALKRAEKLGKSLALEMWPASKQNSVICCLRWSTWLATSTLIPKRPSRVQIANLSAASGIWRLL